MKKPLITICPALCCWGLFGIAAHAAPIPAFPGAEGFGAYSNGGRGGDVYIVTNLEKSGDGSFLQGLQTAPQQGRTIVFAVSGFIPIHRARITSPNLTIAGQTAPGDGICIKGSSLTISAPEVVIRHVRFRHGKDGTGGDCINPDENARNLVMDHCDVMFGADENFSSFRMPAPTMTFSWSTNAWGIYGHSCGGLWNIDHATAHHTLWANNKTRNPKVIFPKLLDWVNNVTFGWDIGMNLAGADRPGLYKVNLLGSSFIHGERKANAVFGGGVLPDGTMPYHVFVNDCAMDGNGPAEPAVTASDYGIIDTKATYHKSAVRFPQTLAADPGKSNDPVLGVPVTLEDRETAYCKVISQVGPLRMNVRASRPLRDELTTLLVTEVAAQKRRKITDEAQTGVSNGGFADLASEPAPVDSDRDGMPDFWENALGSDPAKANHNELVSENSFLPEKSPIGYTRLEEYLHYLSIPHGILTQGETVTIDLAKYTSGFVKKPVFSISGCSGGTIKVSQAGSSHVTFIPAAEKLGRGGFDFTVKDADGHSWTQHCALLVTAR